MSSLPSRNSQAGTASRGTRLYSPQSTHATKFSHDTSLACSTQTISQPTSPGSKAPPQTQGTKPPSCQSHNQLSGQQVPVEEGRWDGGGIYKSTISPGVLISTPPPTTQFLYFWYIRFSSIYIPPSSYTVPYMRIGVYIGIYPRSRPSYPNVRGRYNIEVLDEAQDDAEDIVEHALDLVHALLHIWWECFCIHIYIRPTSRAIPCKSSSSFITIAISIPVRSGPSSSYPVSAPFPFVFFSSF